MPKATTRDFCQILGDIRNGGAVDELTDNLRELVEAVRDTGRAGKLTLTIAVKPASSGDTHVLTVEDQIKITKPLEKKGAAVFFANTNNDLTRNDPRQPELAGLRRPEEPATSMQKEQVAQ
jgi:hypothetical protein